jgi:hypothetical protein
MAHKNVDKWLKDKTKASPRPCDWCGDPLDRTENYIHEGTCATCGRRCYKEETRFYTQLGYDGDSDIRTPDGYKIVIPK